MKEVSFHLINRAINKELASVCVYVKKKRKMQWNKSTQNFGPKSI